jgi:RNA polymerase sigma-70 factor, ECF subfamily
MTTDIENIWTNFHQELRVFIQNKTRHTADTDDILQDVFLKIANNYGKVAKADDMRRYLFAVVRNAISDHFRNRKPVSETADISDDWTEQESESLNATVAERCIKPFIDKLPPLYREALLITEFQQVSQKELSDRLGISYSGAKSRVQRGKEKLKELILECCLYQSDVYGNLISHSKNNCACA